MQKINLLLLILLCSTTAFSQNAFQDAKTIIKLQRKLNQFSADDVSDSTKKKKEAATETVTGILFKYINSSHDTLTLSKLQTSYGFSTYISNIIDKNTPKAANIATVKDRLREKAGKLTADNLTTANALLTKIDIIDSLHRSAAFKKFKALQADTLKTDSIKLADLTPYRTSIITNAYLAFKNNILTTEDPSKIQNLYVSLHKLMIGTDILDTAKIIRTFNNNNALSEQVLQSIDIADDLEPGTRDIINEMQSTQETQKEQTQQAVAAKMSLPSESEVIDAVAIYLVGRVKTEASLAFFDLIRKKLKSDSILLTLFPKTNALLSNFQTYETPNFGQQWRHAFSEDFVNIPDKLAGDQDLQHYFEAHLGGPGNLYFNFFKDAVKLCSMSRDNANFIDIIEYLGKDLNDKNDYLLSSYIRFLHMINNEFYSAGNAQGNYWISYSEFNKMTPEEFQVMAGLLKQKYPEVFNFIQVRLNNNDDKELALPSVNDLRSWMSRIFFIINQYQIAIQHPDPANKDKAHDVSSYWTFIGDSFQQFIKQENNVFIVKVAPLMAKDPNFTRYYGYLKLIGSTYQQITGLYAALQDKNYPHVLETIRVLLESLENPDRRYEEIFTTCFLADKYQGDRNFQLWIKSHSEYREFYNMVKDYQSHYDNFATRNQLGADSVSIHDYALTLRLKPGFGNWFKDGFKDNTENFTKNFTGNYAWFKQNYHDQRFQTFSKVLSFINDVMSTSNSQDLSNMISSYASPPQSYRIKRSSRFSWDLNAYAGFVGGLESPGAHAFYGVTAPIGVAFSWGGTNTKTGMQTLNKNGEIVYLRGNSNSLALTLIDIGAVVRYRFQTGAAQGLPSKVNFSQFISPALQYHIGIKDTPLDFVFGVQYLPKLRTITDGPAAGAAPDQKSVFAANIGIVFDLPLMNFYHK